MVFKVPFCSRTPLGKIYFLPRELWSLYQRCHFLVCCVSKQRLEQCLVLMHGHGEVFCSLSGILQRSQAALLTKPVAIWSCISPLFSFPSPFSGLWEECLSGCWQTSPTFPVSVPTVPHCVSGLSPAVAHSALAPPSVCHFTSRAVHLPLGSPWWFSFPACCPLVPSDVAFLLLAQSWVTLQFALVLGTQAQCYFEFC